MKKLTIILVLVVSFGFIISISNGSEISQDQAIKLFTMANNEYANAHKLMSSKKTIDAIAGFKKATEQYEGLIEKGFINGQIYYNLANSYYRQGQPGKAMLFYNRSAKLIPRNSELKENIKLVKTEFEDKELSGKAPGIVKAMFFWYFLFNLNESTIFALSFYIAFMICILVYIFIRYEWIKSLCTGFGIAMIVAGISFGIKFYNEQVNVKGIVISKECSVRYGPGEEYEPKFLIHEGAEFLVEDESNEWYKVYVYVDIDDSDSNGENTTSKEQLIGWIQKDKAGII